MAPLSIPEQNLECRTLSKSELLSVDEMILTNMFMFIVAFLHVLYAFY